MNEFLGKLHQTAFDPRHCSGILRCKVFRKFHEQQFLFRIPKFVMIFFIENDNPPSSEFLRKFIYFGACSIFISVAEQGWNMGRAFFVNQTLQ